jgi:hypothetical protein
VAPSAAAADTIGGGRTNITLNKSLYRLMRADGVEVSGLRPAGVDGRRVTLPVSSGLLESTYGTGYLFYKGGIVMKAGGHKVALRKLLLNTEKDWLRGSMGGTKLFVATARDRRARRDGFDGIAVALELRLTRRAAAILNRRLGLDGVFRGRQRLGAVSTSAKRDQVTVTGGTLYLAVDAGFDAKLQSLEVELRPQETGTAAGSAPQTLALPLLPSGIRPDLREGGLYSEAGFTLIGEGSPGRQARFLGVGVPLESGTISGGLWMDPVPPFPGLVGTTPIANVSFASAIDRTTGAVTAPSTPATLAPGAAARFNEAFAPPGETVFNAGEPFAAVSFAVQTR